MRPHEARAGHEASFMVGQPWQLKQFELHQGLVVSHSPDRYYTQQYKVVAVQFGTVDFQYRTTRESVNATDGTFYIIEPGETWLSRCKDATIHSLSIDPAWLQQIAIEMTQRERFQLHFPSQFLFDPSLSRTLREIAVSSQAPVSRLQQEELLLSFAQRLLAYAEDPGALPQMSKEHPAVKYAKDYLQVHYAEEVSLQELADVVHLSPFHLARVFRQAVGLPPHAYQTQVRLAHAKTLLAQGYDVGSVANETGFFDQSHFTQQFKRRYQVTPGSYRKTARFSSSVSLEWTAINTEQESDHISSYLPKSSLSFRVRIQLLSASAISR